MHYYQFNIGDYKSHTEHLSEMEDLAYRRLLDWYYLHESPIPNDIPEIARQIRMRSHTESIAIVLREFFEDTKKGWISRRADYEISRAGDKSAKASASAKARWNKGSDANALPTQSKGNATQDTRHITQDTKPKKKETAVSMPDGFPIEAWLAFVDMRKKIKKPMTDHAMKLMIGKLEKMKSAGQDIQAVLEQSITKSWSDVYEIKVSQPQFVNKFDVANVTTPTPKNYDAELKRILADDKKATPVPASLRELAKKWKTESNDARTSTHNP